MSFRNNKGQFTEGITPGTKEPKAYLLAEL